MSADGPGNREVAHRIFAAEFDDASLSYSESDEERAPNYVVTPTGARVNRLFAVGVLTEVESVNEDTVRGRIVDPTGAFVTYAGQYQPDEHAFLGRTTPPAFVALTGKARTFEPDDSDAVYTSVRPESFNDVDAATRDRWSVSAAENTLHRVAVFAAALDSGLRGDELQAALEAAGVGTPLATGIPRAIDHYGTSEAYLEAVRQLSVQALEQVAGDREDVESLTASPDDGGPAELGPLPSVDLDLSVPEEFEAESPTAVDGPETETEAAGGAETDGAEADDHVATGEPAASNEVDAEAGADAETPDPAEPEAEAGESGSADSTPEQGTSDAEPSDSTSEAPAQSADEATDAPASAGEPGAGDLDEDPAAGTEDDLGDFDADGPAADLGDEPADDLGDFDAGDDPGTPSDADASAGGETEGDDGDDAAAEDEEFDDEDALTDEERAEVEAEFGTDFSTGSEVDDPGEAGIDVPTSEEDLEALEDDVEDDSDDGVDAQEAADTEPAAGEPAADPDAEPEPTDDAPAADDSGADEEQEATNADADDDAGDDADAADLSESDVEALAVEKMAELDDGDGAAHDQVVAAVVDETGVDPGTVEDAIQSALMSGQCYEPGDGQLKAI